MPHATIKSIRFFCLNLRFGLADDGPDGWTHRKRCYPALLEQYPCDFYGFQEANDFQVTYLQELLPDHGVIGRRSPAPDRWQHNVIFHHRRWKCMHSDHFYLSRTPDVPSKFPRSKWPRQCTIGVFQSDDTQVTAINTHFDFEPDIQRKSALLIVKRLQDVAPEGPAVLMGDLNAGPGSSCIEALTSPASGFKSAFGASSRGTFHGFSGVARGPNIDWILYRGALERRDAVVATDRYDGRYPSDHFPLTASFRPVA